MCLVKISDFWLSLEYIKTWLKASANFGSPGFKEPWLAGSLKNSGPLGGVCVF
jgi:hypothetical protein